MLRVSPGQTYMDSIKQLSLAHRLITAGVRPPLVSHLCQLGRKVTLRLYKEIHQTSPRQGMMPFDPDWLMRSPTHNLHASLFICLYDSLAHDTTGCLPEAEHYALTLKLYQAFTGKSDKTSKRAATLCGNRGWDLLKQYQRKDSLLMTCADCQSRHLTLSGFPKPFQQCPVCQTRVDSRGRVRWRQINSGRYH